MKLRSMPLLVLLLSVAMATVVCGAVTQDELWDKQSKAHRKWQIELAKLLVTKAPHLKELIEIQRDLQLVMLDMRDARYSYLLKHDPEKIIRTKGLSEWINFPWSEEDDADLRASSSEYMKLDAAKQALRKRNQGHASWTELRKIFVTWVQNSTKYQVLRKTLDDELDHVFQVMQAQETDNKAAAH